MNKKNWVRVGGIMNFVEECGELILLGSFVW